MDPNNFFSEADFDISANIESALADISFSAIDIPADLNAFASQAQSKESFLLNDANTRRQPEGNSYLAPLERSTFLNSHKSFDSTAFDARSSFVSNVLDKAVMDNLDLTFTEVMEKGEPAKRPWKKASHSRATETMFAEEIDQALKSIPESLNLSTRRPELKARPQGILKPYRANTTSTGFNSTSGPSTSRLTDKQSLDLGDLAPLKARLEQIREQRAQKEAASLASSQIPSDLNERLTSLKALLVEEIEDKRRQRIRIEQSTAKHLLISNSLPEYIKIILHKVMLHAPLKIMHSDMTLAEDHFSCFICLQSLSKTILLPCCGKVACEACLDSWFKENSGVRHLRRSFCPHCRRDITNRELISCPLIDTLQIQFERLNAKSGVRLCKLHEEVLKYYCVKCDEACCSDGIAIHGLHNGHEIRLVEKMKIEYEEIYQEAVSEMRLLEDNLSKSASDIMASRKKECIEEINKFISFLEKQLDEDFNEAEAKHSRIAKEVNMKLEELRSDFEGMGQFYELAIQDSNHIVLASDWIGGMKEKIEKLTEEYATQRDSLSIKSEVRPPAWSFKVSRRDPMASICILGQTFFIRNSCGMIEISGNPAFNLELSVIEAGKQAIYHYLPVETLVRHPSEDHSDYGIIVQPSTYKDAYEALLNSKES